MRRERFLEELDGYGKQLEEFQVGIVGMVWLYLATEKKFNFHLFCYLCARPLEIFLKLEGI